MDFKTYISEKEEPKEETTAVMAFGRFNPPTVGHEKLIQKVSQVAKEHKGEAHVVASHSQGTMKDPLPQDKKLQYLHAISPGSVKVSGSSKEQPSLFHVASKLHAAGHSHLVMVAGSDRVDEYQKTLDKYNGVPGKHGYYNFKSIKVVSAGQRDPDAEGVEGMSGTKMRDHARNGRLETFKSGLPDALKPHAEEIADHIRSVKEDYENPYRFDWGTPEGTEYMKKMTPDMKMECGKGETWSEERGMCVPVREAYVSGEIFKLNDLVESTDGTKGKIVYRGATYVTIQSENGDTKKQWLKDVKTLQEDNISITQVKTKMLKPQIPVLLMSRKQIEEKKTSSKITYKELKEMTRDINYNDSKDVRMGIDMHIPDQHVNGKTVGLVSFRSYIESEAERVAKEYQTTVDSVTQMKQSIDKDGPGIENSQNIKKLRTEV